MSLSVYLSRLFKKEEVDSFKICFNLQDGEILHLFVEGAKHSTMWKSGSVCRTNLPILISSGDKASFIPPDAPLKESIKESLESW